MVDGINLKSRSTERIGAHQKRQDQKDRGALNDTGPSSAEGPSSVELTFSVTNWIRDSRRFFKALLTASFRCPIATTAKIPETLGPCMPPCAPISMPP